ncbi:TetR/AcrR family transcriptional regulator [uncultured Aquimarina sp.]|uniref:TetR/AcrR family transcriptional regulator n=1 Tax=uncultured Aquimarina sp. TaxID=575652 RepID=UPI00262D68D9|nr:TetR/AcrR family transcriptional regulator [uncultured Aquimarina sp.]
MNIKHSKEDVLNKGMMLFRLNGYHNTGTNEILRETGISRGSFYNFFKDKDDFGVQVLDYYTMSTTNYINELLNKKGLNAKQRIVHLFEIFTESYTKVNYKWGCLLVGMTQELSGINELFTQATGRNFEELIKPLTICIQQGQEAGVINKGQKPRAMALSIWGSYNGALVLMKSGLHQEPLDAFLENLNKTLKV